MQTTVVAKAIIFDEKGRVLLMRRVQTDANRPGEQDYPGGGVDADEDIMEAVCREIYEESGLRVQPIEIKLFYGHTEARNDKSITRLVFWTQAKTPDVKLSLEHDDFHWTTPEKAVEEFPHPVYSAALAYGLEHRLFMSAV